ncbi:hypothetical protein [Aeromonas caviae]
MSEHTKGLLRVGHSGAVVADHPVPEMSGSDAVEYYGGHLVAESVTAANARRLAACWNACDGFTTEELEAHTGPRLLRARLEGAFARIDELLSERNRVGIDISSAILSGIVPDRHPLRSRLELLANHHKRELMLAELLRRARRYVSPLSCPESEIQIVQSIVSSIDSVLAGQLPDPAVTVTETIRTAPERIWLQVGDQSHYHSEPFPSDTSEVSWCADSVVGCEVLYVRADLAGKLPDHHDQHPDDAAVDHFAVAMKAKLTAAREKGRGGWDDPSACSVEFLADLLVGHVGKGNQGNFEDIANLAMMLHQRGADPAVLAHAATLTTCTRCEGHGIIGGVTGQTPESMDFWEADCPDCDGRGKAKVKGRTLTEGQEFELAAVLQSIANGFSDDPAHDAAALLKRIAGEVQWTGDSFQLPPRQGGEPCDSASLSSSPD